VQVENGEKQLKIGGNLAILKLQVMFYGSMMSQCSIDLLDGNTQSLL